MDLQNFFDPLIVDETHLNRLQSDVENADRRLILDHLGAGIAYGLSLTQSATPDLLLSVAAGVAYDPRGARVELLSPTTVNLALDYNSVSTAVTASNERYVSVFIRQTRTESEAYSDPAATPTTGYLRSVESSALRVVSGTMAATGTATVPAAPDANHVLLGTIKRTFGQTQVYTRDVILGAVEIAHRADDVYAESVDRSLECSPTDPPSLSVVVAEGTFFANGVRVHFAGGSVSLSPAPSTNPRIDLVYLGAGGTLAVRQGTEAASPTYPNTRGVLPVAFVGLDVADVAIMDEDIADARPWHQFESAIARQYRLVASGGETVINLGFEYLVGGHALTVTVDGVVLDDTQYTETTSTSITLDVALIAAEVLVVRALEVIDIASGPLTRVTDDLSGIMEGPTHVEVTTAGALLKVGPIRCCIIGNVRRFTNVVTTVTQPTYAANTWYYLYAAPDDTVGPTALKFEVSITPPDLATGYVFKTGDTTRRYVASLRADATSVLIPMRKTGNRTLYRRTDVSVLLLTLLGGGAAASWTAVSCAGLIPPHAHIGRFRVRLSGDAGGGTGEVRTHGTSTSSVSLSAPVLAGGTVIAEDLEMEVDATANRLEYQVSSLSALAIYGVGFDE